MSAELPLAGLKVARSIRMAQDQAIFAVAEAVTNTRHLGRVYNIVQHPTIGPPFLDESTRVDANGTRGFMQETPMPTPEDPEVRWPYALKKDGTEVDIRGLTDDAAPAVVSYIIDEEYGWTTAINASAGLLIGYIWPVAEYPWFDAWRHVRDGKPFARGLEFGTTGLHQPSPVLLEKGRIFGRYALSLYRCRRDPSFYLRQLSPGDSLRLRRRRRCRIRRGPARGARGRRSGPRADDGGGRAFCVVRW